MIAIDTRTIQATLCLPTSGIDNSLLICLQEAGAFINADGDVLISGVCYLSILTPDDGAAYSFDFQVPEVSGQNKWMHVDGTYSIDLVTGQHIEAIRDGQVYQLLLLA